MYEIAVLPLTIFCSKVLGRADFGSDEKIEFVVGDLVEVFRTYE